MRKLAGVYLYEGKFVINPYSRTGVGYSLLTAPETLHTSIEGLVSDLDRVFSYCRDYVVHDPKEPRSKWITPTLKLLGIKHRSYYKFARVALLFDIEEKDGQIIFTPYERAERGSFASSRTKLKQKAPAGDHQALVEACRRTIAALR